MKPEISIIIPVYNVEHYLDRCINSVLNQSFKNFELILINDGSTDNSLNICSKYADIDKRVRLISQINKGQGAARNTGLKYAKGNYICFIDSDDFIEKNYLSTLFNNIEKSDSDISACEYYLTNDVGKKNSVIGFNAPQDIYVLSGKETFAYLCKGGSDANGVVWNKMYKKALFDNIKFKEGYYYEDEFFILPLFYQAKKVSLVKKPLYDYVQRTGSTMHTPLTLKKSQDKAIMYRERVSFFKENKDKVMYGFAVQQYKDWLLEIKESKVDKVDNAKLQSEFRKYFGIRDRNSFESIFKDIVGYINLGILAKFKEAYNKFIINKNGD